MYLAAEAAGARAWSQVEDGFLRAMETFDRAVALGKTDWGDRQNGKGDFFNDLLALLLEQCSAVDLYSRSSVPGLIFRKHSLDCTYPPTGDAQFLLEAKAVGLPKHPDSPKQKDHGRPGSADLDKRVKEVGFKIIDLKAEYGRLQTASGSSSAVSSPGGNLTTWLRQQKPATYLFMCARVVSDRDFDRVLAHVRRAAQVVERVGLFCYEPLAPRRWTSYRARHIPDAYLEIDRVLYQACQDLAACAQRAP